jgi:hypothetical protein
MYFGSELHNIEDVFGGPKLLLSAQNKEENSDSYRGQMYETSEKCKTKTRFDNRLWALAM